MRVLTRKIYETIIIWWLKKAKSVWKIHMEVESTLDTFSLDTRGLLFDSLLVI